MLTIKPANELKNFLTVTQCCIVNRAHQYLEAAAFGLPKKKLFSKAALATILHQRLKRLSSALYDETIIDSSCLSQAEYEKLLETYKNTLGDCACCGQGVLLYQDTDYPFDFGQQEILPDQFPKEQFAPLPVCFAIRLNGIDQGVKMMRTYEQSDFIVLDIGVVIGDHPANDDFKTIFEKLPDDFGLYLKNYLTDGFSFYFNTPEGSFEVTSGTVNTGEYYRVICTYDGGYARIFLNGVLKGTMAATGALFNDNLPDTNSAIGNFSEDSAFKGMVGFVRVYRAAFSQGYDPQTGMQNIVSASQGLNQVNPVENLSRCPGEMEDGSRIALTKIREWLLEKNFSETVVGDDGIPVNEPEFVAL